MLADGTFYADPGADHFRKAEPINRAKALARQIDASDSPAQSLKAEPVSI
jgi:hypothetical protein